jgi:AbrB family looped-hinge helix DNA binding protein
MLDGPQSVQLNDLFLGAVTVGERGQIVIPAEAREAYGLRGGDKLLVFHHPGHCGLMIVRVQDVQRLLEDWLHFMEAVEHIDAEQDHEKAGTE